MDKNENEDQNDQVNTQPDDNWQNSPNQAPFDPSSIYPDVGTPNPQSTHLGHQTHESDETQRADTPGFLKTNGALLLIAVLAIGGPALLAIPMGPAGFALAMYSVMAIVVLIPLAIAANIFLGLSFLSNSFNTGLSKKLLLAYFIDITIAGLSLYAVLVPLNQEDLAWSTASGYRQIAIGFILPMLVLAAALTVQSLRESRAGRPKNLAVIGVVLSALATALLCLVIFMSYGVVDSSPNDVRNSVVKLEANPDKYDVSGQATYGLAARELTVRPKGTTRKWIKTFYESTDQENECAIDTSCTFVGETTNGNLYMKGQRTSRYGNKEIIYYLFSTQTIEATITFINLNPTDEEALEFVQSLKQAQ